MAIDSVFIPCRKTNYCTRKYSTIRRLQFPLLSKEVYFHYRLYPACRLELLWTIHGNHCSARVNTSSAVDWKRHVQKTLTSSTLTSMFDATSPTSTTMIWFGYRWKLPFRSQGRKYKMTSALVRSPTIEINFRFSIKTGELLTIQPSSSLLEKMKNETRLAQENHLCYK